MKTANEQFYANSLLARSKFLYELADLAREKFTLAWDAYLASEGDKAERDALREKANNLCTLYRDASTAAYNAEVRAFYANR
jgi:hypothetical protein